MRERAVAADIESADLRMAAIVEDVTSAVPGLPDADPSGYGGHGGRMSQRKAGDVAGGGPWASRFGVGDENLPD